MTERVFVDVGANDGGTAIQIFQGGYSFDRVISIEPDPKMIAILNQRFTDEIAQGRLQIAPVGLSNVVGKTLLYGDNSDRDATVVPSYAAKNRQIRQEIDLIDWPSFLDAYKLCDARLWIKINVEGAEVAVVDSIVRHDAGNIASMVIDYDIIKTPFGGWKKWRSVRSLRKAGIRFLLKENIFAKRSARPGVANWLCAFAELRDPPLEPIRPPLKQRLRVRYLEVISLLGLRHDLFKSRR